MPRSERPNCKPSRSAISLQEAIVLLVVAVLVVILARTLGIDVRVK